MPSHKYLFDGLTGWFVRLPECEVCDADGVEEVEAVALVAVVAVPGTGATVVGAISGLDNNMPWLI